MNLQTKTIVTVAATFCIFIYVLYHGLSYSLNDQYLDLEEKYARKDMERLVDILEQQIKSLDAVISDYAEWNETYSFMEDRNESYFKRNWQDVLPLYSINAVVLIDSRGKIIGAKAYDYAIGKEVPLPSIYIDVINKNKDLWTAEKSKESKNITGIIQSSAGPLVMTSHKILNDLGQEPSRGYLIAFRLVDANFVKQLGDIAQMPLQIEYFFNKMPSASQTDELKHFFTIKIIDDNHLVGKYVVNTLYGETAFMLIAKQNRDIYASARQSIYYAVNMVFIAGICFALLLALLLRKFILKRLSGLITGIQQISKTRNLSMRIEVRGQDEIADVGKTINDMLSALQEAKDSNERITDERKLLKVELDKRNIELMTLLGSVTDGLYALDNEWRLSYFNNAASNVLDRFSDEFVNKNMWEIYPELINSELYQRFLEARDTKLPIHTIVQSQLDEHWYDYNIYPHQMGIFVFFKDISAKKKFEEEMSRLDGLNLIGEMAASIGHEVRNPLTTVRGFLQLFQSKKELVSYQDYLQTMIDELDRANSIITEFLGLAKNRAIDLKIQNLNNSIKALAPLIQADALNLGNNLILELEELPDVLIDENEIRQCILNLVRNGLESVPRGGTVKIKTFLSKGHVVLAIEDNGPGIPSDIYQKIGTPFITTKENGTGLGLAVCFRIAERHNAKIEVKTGPEGTMFSIHFKPQGTGRLQ